MSLVDYASSSDDDVLDDEHEPPQPLHEPPAPPRPSSPPRAEASGWPSADQKTEAFEKLPDASALLNSPTLSLVSGNDHASVVAAAVAESASRKRDSKGMMELGSNFSVAPPPRAKLPRASIPHSKSVPDTVGGALVPPQLQGRADSIKKHATSWRNLYDPMQSSLMSNVVTEDISKLFVSRNAVGQPRGPEN